jgi:hypothetical protein
MDWVIGPVSAVGSAEDVMDFFIENPRPVFPFDLGECDKNRKDAVCGLGTGIEWELYGKRSPIIVTDISTDTSTKILNDSRPTTFEFTTLEGHFAGPGSTIRFRTYEKFGQVYLQQQGNAPNANRLVNSGAGQTIVERIWNDQAYNLNRLLT